MLLIRDFQKAASRLAIFALSSRVNSPAFACFQFCLNDASILAIFKPDFASKLAKLHTVTLMYFSCPFFFKCLYFFLHQNESSTCLPLHLIISHVLCFYDARFSKSLITSAFSLKKFTSLYFSYTFFTPLML